MKLPERSVCIYCRVGSLYRATYSSSRAPQRPRARYSTYFSMSYARSPSLDACSKHILSARTKWSVESSHTIHILPVLRLLLLPHPVDIVSRHLRLLRAPEARKTHHLPHQCHFGIFIYVHMFFRWSRGTWFCAGSLRGRD